MKDDFNDFETAEFTETLLTFMTLLQTEALQKHNPGQWTSYTRVLLERKLIKRSFSDFEESSSTKESQDDFSCKRF